MRSGPGVKRAAAIAVAVALTVGLAWAAGVAALPPRGPAAKTPAKATGRPSLAQATADLKIPPAWMAATQVSWDTSKPWKDGRLEIRRLLGLGSPDAPDTLRQAMKLTVAYAEKNDIGNGHEYPMYIYLGCEFAWAIRAHEDFLRRMAAIEPKGLTGPYLSLASCYVHFGEYAKAVQAVQTGLRFLPDPPWDVSTEAHACDILGDVYAVSGDPTRARAAYARAMQLLPTSKQPYGRNLLPQKVSKIQAKVDLLAMGALPLAGLKDGTTSGTSLGYIGDVTTAVTLRGGRITDVRVQHKENIPLGSTETLPKRIIEVQGLNVDAVTAATTTCDAIRDGALQALRKAGLKK
jgi:uncharacterized protein with FMN-binding domain